MITDSIPATKLLYLEDTYQFNGTGIIVSMQEVEGKGTSIILDQTIFYPQGGGQPADQGEIRTKGGARFAVTDVRMIDGVVHHFGNLAQGILVANEEAILTVDPERRQLHARLHSAGHLIDAAVQLVGLSLAPTKGYHFPDGPYVEYEGEIAADQRENVRVQLETKVNELINSQLPTQIISTNKAGLAEICSFVPDYVNDNKPIRVVTMVPKLGCPCGGTHIKNSSEIGKINLTKIRVKSAQTRISYT